MTTINERLRQIRKTNGETLEQFGKKIGYHRATVSQVERGAPPYNGRADLKYIRAVSEVYHVSERWIMTGEGEATQAVASEAQTHMDLMLGMYRALPREYQERVLEIAKAIVAEEELKCNNEDTSE